MFLEYVFICGIVCITMESIDRLLFLKKAFISVFFVALRITMCIVYWSASIR